MAANFTATLVNDKLADGKAHPYALNILSSCPSKLSEELEELIHILGMDSSAFIDHINV